MRPWRGLRSRHKGRRAFLRGKICGKSARLQGFGCQYPLPQQFLYFFPLLQGQGSLRPTLRFVHAWSTICWSNAWSYPLRRMFGASTTFGALSPNASKSLVQSPLNFHRSVRFRWSEMSCMALLNVSSSPPKRLLVVIDCLAARAVFVAIVWALEFIDLFQQRWSSAVGITQIVGQEVGGLFASFAFLQVLHRITNT